MRTVTIYIILAIAIFMNACASEDFYQERTTDDEITKIEAIITPFKTDKDDARTTFWMGNYGEYKDIVWSEGDTIGIYPSKGDQLSFPIVEGVGKTVCEFNGGGWALKPSTAINTYTYTAYTPFKRNYYFYKENNALPVSMIGQKQKGNNNTAHLGAYDLQIAKGTTPTNGKISFAFEHQVAFVRMDIIAPCKAVWKSIKLESNAAFTTEATMNLTLETPTLTPMVKSNYMTLNLENVNTNDSLHIVAYMMMLPVDFTNKTLNLTLKDSDDNIYTAPVSIVNANKNFRASYYKWIKVEFKEGVEPTIPYVTFMANAEQTLTMSKAVETLEYSVNGGDWNTLGTTTVTFGGEHGNLQLRGKNPFGTSNSLTGSSVKFANHIIVTSFGDIRTLIDYENYRTTDTSNATFVGLFKNCKTLLTTPELPATTLSDSCYYEMFSYCTMLATAPELPATTLADNCYDAMFHGCTLLTTAPKLPATALAKYCYHSMFSHCTSLTRAPELPAITLADGCYSWMFNRCTSLYTAPKLPATTLANFCYYVMFSNCTSLTTAPELPATTLAYECYSSMFSSCTSLTIAPKLPATTLANNCYRMMFSHCTSLTTAPELPATILTDNCYDSMFWGCRKLDSVTMIATNINAINCLFRWLLNVSSIGTFTKAKEMTSLPTGDSGIPEEWTVKDKE